MYDRGTDIASDGHEPILCFSFDSTHYLSLICSILQLNEAISANGLRDLYDPVRLLELKQAKVVNSHFGSCHFFGEVSHASSLLCLFLFNTQNNLVLC